MHRSFGQIKVSGLNMHRSIHDISGNLHHNRTKSSSKGTCHMYDIRQTSILKINKESTRSQKIRCIRIICLLIINHHLQAATLLHDIVQTSSHAHDFSYQQTITHTYHRSPIARGVEKHEDDVPLNKKLKQKIQPEEHVNQHEQQDRI